MAESSPLQQPAPPRHGGTWRKAYFGTPANSVVTLLCIAVIALVAKIVIAWLLVEATFQGSAEDCRLSSGACWPYLAAKLRYMLFGVYPFEEQWRPLLAVIVFLAAIALSCAPRFWRRTLLVAWLLLLPLLYLLIAGGALGLTAVPTTQWGGLPLSFMLSFVGLVCALPLGILLALGRLSNLPAIRVLSIAFIELVRGVPLISVLFMASVMLPLFMPDGMTINKLLRAQVAIILFAAAYIAEIVRAGLQALPKGQTEAAQALGLHYWQYTFLVVVPQALKAVIPPLVSLFIGFFQDTTLVTIIGLLDFLDTVRTALRDPNWQGTAVLEGYLFAAAVYFMFSALMGGYSRFLERHFRMGHG